MTAPVNENVSTGGGTYQNLACLPIWIVLDTSVSMSRNGAFVEAFEMLPQLVDEMSKDQVVADKLQIEVIGFDVGARVLFPLGGHMQLEDWLKKKELDPIDPNGDWTHYGDAFKILRERIEQGVSQLGGDELKVYRPAVFFITDGKPTHEDKAYRDKQYAVLTDNRFKYRPNILCFGTGDATLDDLIGYGAGRHHHDEYTTANADLVFVSRDGVTPAAFLAATIKSLVATIVQSIKKPAPTNGSANNTNGDIEDVFALQPDLFDSNLFIKP